MKRIFSTSFNTQYSNIWLLLLRVASGAFMLTHGYPKFLKLIGGEAIQFADPFGIGEFPSFVLVVVAEFVCSILIILGLATRISSLFIIVTMAVAAFYAHGADPFGKKEMSLLFLLIFITILVFGPGKYSLDHAIGSKANGPKRY